MTNILICWQYFTPISHGEDGGVDFNCCSLILLAGQLKVGGDTGAEISPVPWGGGEREGRGNWITQSNSDPDWSTKPLVGFLGAFSFDSVTSAASIVLVIPSH